jgi:hypothetical protein
MNWLGDVFGWEGEVPEPLPMPINAPVAVIPPPVVLDNPEPAMDPYLTTLVPWTTQKNYFHNVRVLCDRAGLTVIQKNILCACIYVESQFRDYKSNGTPVTNWNKDPITGEIWSTDYGLVQVNDYWQIKGYGKGSRFPSVQYVLTHPEETAGWMINTIKTTGKLQPWASYTSGVYKQHLVSTSPMWKLKT